MYWSPDAINLVLIATALLAVLLPFSVRINLALRQFFPRLIIIHSIYRMYTMFGRGYPTRNSTPTQRDDAKRQKASEELESRMREHEPNTKDILNDIK